MSKKLPLKQKNREYYSLSFSEAQKELIGMKAELIISKHFSDYQQISQRLFCFGYQSHRKICNCLFYSARYPVYSLRVSLCFYQNRGFVLVEGKHR